MTDRQAIRESSPAPSIVSMELDDVNFSDVTQRETTDRPVVRSFLRFDGGNERSMKRRSSLENFGRFGLLTPALALAPAIDGQDELTKTFTELQGENRELILAAAHIDDALKGRGRYGKARAMFKPKFAQRCFTITSNVWFQRLIYVVIMLHSILVFFEPPSTDSVFGWVLALNIICLLLYVTDVALTITFMNWTVFWTLDENALNRGELVFLVFFAIDYVLLVAQFISGKYILQPFRCLRAAMLIFKAKNVSHIYRVLISIVLKLGKVFVAIALFILVFSAVGVHMFMDDYQCDNVTRSVLGCEPSVNQTSADDIYQGAFNNIFIAALRLFVLITTENYPSFMFPTLIQTLRSWFFFGAFIYIGVFILTAILLAIIVEAYWLYFKISVKEERYREREELAKAWNLLDPLANGDLPVEDPKFLSLFRILKPNHTDEENRQLIQLIDTENDGFIDSYQWTIQLRNVVEAKFEHRGKDLFPDRLHHLKSFANKLVSYPFFRRMIMLLIAVHSILFCLRWRGMTDDTEITIQAIKTVIVSFFGVEMLFRSLTWKTAIIYDYFELIDCLLVIVSLFCNVAVYPVTDLYVERVLTVVSGVAVVCRAALNRSGWKHSVANVMTSFVPVMWDLTILYSIVVFFFAVIGMEAFHQSEPHQTVIDNYNHYNYNCQLGFIDFRCSLLVVFQLTTSSNWHELMNAAMLSAGDGAAVYFVVSFIFINLIVMNLFVAIAIEAFQKYANSRDTEKSEKDELTWKDKLKHWFYTFVGSAQLRKLRRDGDDEDDMKIRSPSTLPRSRQGSMRRSLDNRDINGAAVAFEPPTSDGETSDDHYAGLTADKRYEVKMKQKMKKRKRARRMAQKGMMVVRVMMAFTKSKDSEISLEQGEEVVVVDKVESWMKGKKSDGAVGWFPSSHVCQLNDNTKSTESTATVPLPSDDNTLSSDPNVATKNRPSNIDTSMATSKARSGSFSQQVSIPSQRSNSLSSPTVFKFPDTAVPGTPGGLSSNRNPGTPQFGSTNNDKPKLIMGKGGDWRRTIQDMTVMNPEEMHRLNKLLKKDMKASRIARRGARVNQVAPIPVTQSEKPLLDISEETPVPLTPSAEQVNPLKSFATVSMPAISQPAISVEAIDELPEEIEENTRTQNSSTTNTLTVPGMVVEPKPKKKTAIGGEMPDWVKRFQLEHSVVVHEDGIQKGEKSDGPSPGSPERMSPNSSRKNSVTSSGSPSPVIVIS